MKQAATLLQQARFAEAESICQSLLQLHPEQPDALHLLAVLKAGQKDYAAATLWFERAIKAAPSRIDYLANFANALVGQGMAEKALGRTDAATASFERVLVLQPDHAKAAQLLREVSPAWLAPLQGRRLQLRLCREADADFLQACFSNGSFVAQYNRAVPTQQSLAQLRKQLADKQTRHPSQNKTIDWVICERQSGRCVGLANLVDLKLPHGNAEFLVGIPALADRAGGTGLEASLLVLEYAFNVAGLHKVTSYVYADNPEAQHNTLTLGFKQEALLREHIREKDSGPYLDVYGNALLATEFKSNARLARLSLRLLGRDITQGNTV